MLIPISVFARTKTRCDYKLLSDLKKLTSNINTSYVYRIEDGIVYYDITLTNIQSDMYFVDNITSRTYYYGDTVNGEITLKDYYSGKVNYTFYSNNNECLNEKLGNKIVNLPYYNDFYNYDECNGHENYKLCQRWTEFNGTYYDFLNNIERYIDYGNDDNYEDSIDINWFDKLVSMYINYYYILLPITIILVVLVLYLIKYIKNRLNRFDI